MDRGFDPHNHHPIEQMATVPASEPTHTPAVDVVAYRGQFSEAQELRFELHMLSHMHGSSWGETVNQACRDSVRVGAVNRLESMPGQRGFELFN